MGKTFRVVVLISGNGSNLQALIDKQHDYGYTIIGVVSNRAKAFGLERAKVAGIASLAIDERTHPTKQAFERALLEAIEEMRPDLVVMAGFMRILGEDFTKKYEHRLINIHPSLLPKYKGLHTYRRALDAGDAFHGTTAHFVTPELDGGAIIASMSTQIMADDNETTLKTRVQKMEHQLYPVVVKWFAEKRLFFTRGHVWLDDKKLPKEGHLFSSDDT